MVRFIFSFGYLLMFKVVVTFLFLFLTKMDTLPAETPIEGRWEKSKLDDIMKEYGNESASLHPTTKKKRSFLVFHDLLCSITPLLKNCEHIQEFCDTFYDSAQNDLLLHDGLWLVYGLFLDGETDPVLKLRTSVKTSERTIEWTEFQKETEMIELLRLADLIHGNPTDLMSHFGFPYLTIPTKRYHLVKNKIWVDFFGWAASALDAETRGIFAICSFADDLIESDIPKELCSRGSKNECEANKTLLMLYHRNRSLFDKVYGFGKTMESVPICEPFDDFDFFLGMMKAFEEPLEFDETNE